MGLRSPHPHILGGEGGGMATDLPKTTKRTIRVVEMREARWSRIMDDA